MLRRATPTTTSRPRPSRLVSAALLTLPLLLAQACEPTPTPTTTSTTQPKTTTTTARVTTTTTAAPTTTTTAAPTTTTTSAPGSGSSGLTKTDTGLSRVRVVLTSQAAWMDVTLRGTAFDVTRVVSTTGGLQITALGPDRIATWGQGTAVVDVVLRVAPGASTSLAMCKNYLGPATVSVHRRTAGDEEIAAIDNGGTSPVVVPGSCENPAAARLTRADLIGPVRWPARRDARPLVLANYYPWYDPAALAQTFGDQPTGPADTSSAAQVQQAVDLARSSGVDGFVVEYEATAAHEPKIDLAFAAADARPGFTMAMMLDFAILEHRPLGLTDAGLDAALAEVASHAARPSQLEVGGQPVVFVYYAARVDPAAWAAALDRLAATTGLRPVVVTDDPVLGNAARYDYGTNHLAGPAELGSWADGRVFSLQEQPGLDGVAGPLWVAPVSPGYDDRALGRPTPLYTPRNGGVRYEQSWDAALRSLPDWVLITSWNEYYEQTHVMPGATTGNLALTQTKTRAASFHTTG